MERSLQLHAKSSGKAAKTLLLLGLSLGYFLVLLDTTVVSIALPAIHADLGGGIAGLQWVANAYTIVFAGLLLSMGTLADRWGARRVYLLGLLLFLAASAASAAVPSLAALIALRAALGLGAAALMPASLALLAHAFPQPAERARALGVWAAITGVAMAAGPVAGGMLTDSLGWRSIFLLNVPLAAASLVMTRLLVGETPRKTGQRFDYAGQAAAIAAIVLLSFALMEGAVRGWGSPLILGAFGTAAASGAAFVATQAMGKAPLLPLRLFRQPAVSAGMLAGMAVNAGLSGVLFVLPLFLQQASGLSARLAGLALLPMTVPMAFNPIFTGRIVGRIGARLPMTAGFALAAVGAWLLAGADAGASASGAGYPLILAGLLLVGFGVSFTIPALMMAVISAVPRELSGTASGALNASRQLGATIGVAVAAMLLSGGGSITAGTHASLALIGAVLLGGSLLSFAFIRPSAE